MRRPPHYLTAVRTRVHIIPFPQRRRREGCVRAPPRLPAFGGVPPKRRASRRATRHGQWPSRGVRRPRRSPPHTPRVAKGDLPRSLAFARRSPDSPLPTLIMPRRAPAPNIALALHPTPRGDRDTAGNASGVLKVADAPAWLAQRFWSLALGGGCSRPPSSQTLFWYTPGRGCVRSACPSGVMRRTCSLIPVASVAVTAVSRSHPDRPASAPPLRQRRGAPITVPRG